MQSLIDETSSVNGAQSPVHSSFIGPSCDRPRESWSTSRGIILPVAALDIILSRSPMLPICSWTAVSFSLLPVKLLTMSYLEFSSFRSTEGIASHPLNSREPIGEQHLSMTSTSATPSPPDEAANNSKFLIVKRSIQTNLLPSILEIEQMFANPVCCVCSRYTTRAPAEQMPRGYVSMAYPFRDSTFSCLFSFSTAES